MATTDKVVWRNWLWTGWYTAMGVMTAATGFVGVANDLFRRNGDSAIELGQVGSGSDPAALIRASTVVWLVLALTWFLLALSQRATYVDGVVMTRRGFWRRRAVRVEEIDHITVSVFGGPAEWKDQGKGTAVLPVMVLRDRGERLGIHPLGSGTVDGWGPPGDKTRDRANKIADILGVPYVDPAESAAATAASGADAVAT